MCSATFVLFTNHTYDRVTDNTRFICNVETKITHHPVTEADGHGRHGVSLHCPFVEAAVRPEAEVLQLGGVGPHVRHLGAKT